MRFLLISNSNKYDSENNNVKIISSLRIEWLVSTKEKAKENRDLIQGHLKNTCLHWKRCGVLLDYKIMVCVNYRRIILYSIIVRLFCYVC
jgi:hypothetical protein